MLRRGGRTPCLRGGRWRACDRCMWLRWLLKSVGDVVGRTAWQSDALTDAACRRWTPTWHERGPRSCQVGSARAMLPPDRPLLKAESLSAGNFAPPPSLSQPTMSASAAGWTSAVDASSGKTYYVNGEVTQWDPPAGWVDESTAWTAAVDAASGNTYYVRAARLRRGVIRCVRCSFVS